MSHENVSSYRINAVPAPTKEELRIIDLEYDLKEARNGFKWMSFLCVVCTVLLMSVTALAGHWRDVAEGRLAPDQTSSGSPPGTQRMLECSAFCADAGGTLTRMEATASGYDTATCVCDFPTDP